MNLFYEFDSSVAFQRFLREHAITWPEWRSLRIWLRTDGDAFIVECRKKEYQSLYRDAKPVKAARTNGSTELRLDDLWTRAQLVMRHQHAGTTPKHHMLLLKANEADVARLVIDEAPAGLEMLELKCISETEGASFQAFIVHGDAGRILAHSPPHGCYGFECDELPRGGIAAMPIGFTLPSMLEELWPVARECVVLYLGDGHFPFVTTVVKRLPLVTLIRTDPKPLLSLSEHSKRIVATPWHVVRSLRRVVDDDEHLEDERLRVKVVYRLRTFDHAPVAGESHARSRGHELGRDFLQVLDECEAGLLPEVRYAAVDIGECERWHFLCLQNANQRLLDAWNMIERFDHISVLEPHGIHAYLSVASRMLPPVEAMLGGGSSDRAIGQRIGKMLGSPPPGTIVLIEDLEHSTSANVPSATSVAPNPRLIHVDLSKAKLLSEVLPSLVRDWNNAEPIRALLGLSTPEGVSSVRTEINSILRTIGCDEDNLLRTAIESAQAALERWATEAAQSIKQASIPVAEAKRVCDELVETLRAGDGSIQRASYALTTFCKQLTEPRRNWITEQTSQAATQLAQVAPRNAEAQIAQVATAHLRDQMEQLTQQLGRATEELRTLAPQIEERDRAAENVLIRVGATRGDVETRASATIYRIAARMERVREHLEAAQRQNNAVEKERQRLAAEESNVEKLESATRTLAAQNQAKEQRLKQRQTDATEQRQRLERARDIQIPMLEKEAIAEEQRLKQLDGKKIERRLANATAKLKQLTDELNRLRVDADICDTLARECALRVRDIDERRKSLTTLQNETETAKNELVGKKKALDRAMSQDGDQENCKAGIALIKKALVELDALRNQVSRRPSSWAGSVRQWFGRGKA